MDTIDRLIEYYFQRRIAGIEVNEIESSLEQYVLREDERAIILKNVAFKETAYNKIQENRKAGNLTLLIGALLFFSTCITLSYFYISQTNYINPIVVYSFVTAGLASMAVGLFLRQT